MQQHQHSQNITQPKRRERAWWVFLLILAAFGIMYFYIVPFFSSAGTGEQSGSLPNGWTATQQEQIAMLLAENVQNYRQKIHEGRRINYGDAYMQVSGFAEPFRPTQPYAGMNAPTPPENDMHSESRLKGWGLYIIRNKLQGLPSGSVVNMLIFTQVKVCPPCRNGVQTWAKELQQAAPAGVRVNIYIWQQTNFDIDHPDQTPVRTANDVEFAVSSTAP